MSKRARLIVCTVVLTAVLAVFGLQYCFKMASWETQLSRADSSVQMLASSRDALSQTLDFLSDQPGSQEEEASYQELSDRLAYTEEQLQESIEHYNQLVSEYNGEAFSAPFCILSRLSGREPLEQFPTNE
ncbi:MAG TPA: hypothetical protein IAB22_06820 [Candidatus Merdivicinus intestinavium]|nr:hypothetical protein [Candidatus Merdivicinus intestinavium]